MSLSSNTIIHFTNTKSVLKKILKHNFKVSYCKENPVLCGHEKKFCAPMVSFCDIPLSEVKMHIKKYGSYGIGLTKEWAVENKLNPVLYIDGNSNLSNSFATVLKDFLSKAANLSELNDTQKALLDVLRYMKNYQGNLTRRGKTICNYRFSDEREWRYLPPLDSSFPMILSHENFNKNKEEYNRRANTILLNFEPKDIKYIIIKNDVEISEFIKELKDKQGKTYSHYEIERLTTRIITAEQINSDI